MIQKMIEQEEKRKIIAHMKKLKHSPKDKENYYTCQHCDCSFYIQKMDIKENVSIAMYLLLEDKWELFWQMDASEEKYRLWQTLPCFKLIEEKEKFLNRLKELIAFK
jgi:hypothetical protein